MQSNYTKFFTGSHYIILVISFNFIMQTCLSQVPFRQFIVSGDYLDGLCSFTSYNPNLYFHHVGGDGTDSASVDFDNDGLVDYRKIFSFSHALGCGGAYWLYNSNRLSSNWQMAQNSPANGYVHFFNTGDTINKNLNWLPPGSFIRSAYHFLANGTGPTCPPSNTQINTNISSRYLGLRKIQNNDTIYAWVKISINNTLNEYVHSFSVVGGPLPIGIKGNKEKEGLINVWPNPTSGVLRISTENIKGKIEISIVNALGEEIKKQHKEIQNDLYELDVSEVPKGIYLLRIETEKGVLTKKVLVNKVLVN